MAPLEETANRRPCLAAPTLRIALKRNPLRNWKCKVRDLAPPANLWQIFATAERCQSNLQAARIDRHFPCHRSWPKALKIEIRETTVSAANDGFDRQSMIALASSPFLETGATVVEG